MRNNVKISFWLMKSKANPTKQLPIYMKKYFQGKGVRISTGHFIQHALWDKKKKKIALANNVPVETLSKMLGHRSISITLQAYASITDDKISEDFKDLRKQLAIRNRLLKNKANRKP